MNQSVATSEAFDKLGGAPGIAKRFKISNQAAQKWRERIPHKRANEVASITGIPASELRPDVFGVPESEAAA